MLRDVPLKAVYRSETDNLLEDFYIPALKASVAYDRAVGYFSASMLTYAAQGLSALIENDGKMRLIFGGELDPEDEHAIREGYEFRQVADRLGDKILTSMGAVSDALFSKRLEALSWLVATGHLDIKVALKKKGMYHEKIGIFTDVAGDRVVFQGSANETTHALLPDFNFESINVFQCWREELAPYYDPYLVGFENLWRNNSPNTLVLDFPDAARERLIKVARNIRKPPTPALETELWRKYQEREDEGESPAAVNTPSIPPLYNGEEFVIRPHQRRALEAWRANNLKGILALATGAGKTITAVYGAARVFERTKKLFLVIAAPYQNLADQWVDVLREFNIHPVRCYGNSADWISDMGQYLTLFQTGAVRFVCVVVVNRTLQSSRFQQYLAQVPGQNLMFVGDECHHHGSEKLAASLPQQAALRMGLSATPEHYLDSAANARIADYYGPVVATYDLGQALEDKILTPYRYHITVVDLTEDEAEEYRQLSEQISRLYAMKSGSEESTEKGTSLDLLLFKRARLLGSARNKLHRLRSMLADSSPKSLTLIYCGDGSTEDEDTGDSLRQVEAASGVLHSLGWKSSLFTSRESRSERQTLLDHFRIGIIDSLVAIRCLDEGIDVPACRTAYILASSRNPRQFIQRRGRILRRSPGKERADVYDFLVKIPEQIAEGSEFERNLLRSELERVVEFARLSMNAADAVRELSPLLQLYDLEHVLVG